MGKLRVSVWGWFVWAAFSCSQAAYAEPGLPAPPASQNCTVPDRPPVESLIDLELVASIDFPVAMVQAPGVDNRWYVVDREGYVNVYQDGETFSLLGRAIDIQDQVRRDFEGTIRNEMGMVGIVFHPNFATNGYVYLYYSATSTTPGYPLEARLSRFISRDGGLTFDRSSETVILAVTRDKYWHWSGNPQFGDDGYLYITVGDGGRPPLAQNLYNLNGSMLRIDVDGGTPYSIPPDNPYVGGGGAPEIYAHGFRNAWRWTFDRETDEIWLGDVGDADYEEINKIVKGGNYGWNVLEGNRCTNPDSCNITGMIPPHSGFDHDPGSAFNAIIGGYVYRGTDLDGLQGVYLYADNYTGKVFALRYDTGGEPYSELLIESGQFATSFAEGNDNELYLLAQYGVYRLINPEPLPPSDFPQTLADTGCFSAADLRQPAEGLIPYTLNTPLWSDGADKERWMALPPEATISVDADGDFVFPPGTVLIKNFSLGGRIVETRLFMHHDDGDWGGYSYEWNDAQTNATLLPAGKAKVIGAQTWTFPSRSQCMQCHTEVAGRSIGPELAQLNSEFTYPATGITANQLETLEHIGMFAEPLDDIPANLPALPPLDDTEASLEARARGYLHANCAHCHQPGGPGQGPSDFRYHVTLGQMNTINVAPTQGWLGIADAELIYPGSPAQSIVSSRMHRLDLKRMPPIGTELVDTAATSVVDAWIESLSSSETCGAPTYSAGDAAAVYLWEICGTGIWQMRATSGGEYARMTGLLESTANLSSVSGYSLEPHDVFNATANRVSFDLQMWGTSEDGFYFNFERDAGTCLTIDDPGVPVYWGADKTLVVSPVDLDTLSVCGAEPPPEGAQMGRPDYDPTTDTGMFLWQETSGLWQLRLTAGGDYARYVGSISAETPFPSMVGYSIEPHDAVDYTTDPSHVSFDAQIWDVGEDGLTFRIPDDGITCMDTELPATDPVVIVGGSNLELTPPFDLLTLGPCESGCHP